MINITQDINSLTDFKKNTNDFIADLKKTGRPSILTINGKAELVIMDAAAYQKIQEDLESKITLSEIKQSLEEFELGKASSATEVINKLKTNIQE